MTESNFPTQLYRLSLEAEGIISLYLRAADGTPLPPADPGGHIDLFLPNGISRSYSLSNMPQDSGIYRLTVARDVNSRGGSQYLHDSIRVGDTIEISAQHNNFELVEDAPQSVFIAGGIGITPFIPMMARLNECGRSWLLHYSARTRQRAALLDDISQLEQAGEGEVRLNFDEEPGGKILDLAAILSSLADGSHVYCCGPEPMLNAFRAGADKVGLDDQQVHFEYFKGDVDKAEGGGFTVVCRQSNVTVQVEPGDTILESLASAGVDLPSSCEQGICGACETRVLEGEPDHRDLILSQKEQDANNKMFICCSGSKSASLILDC